MVNEYLADSIEQVMKVWDQSALDWYEMMN